MKKVLFHTGRGGRFYNSGYTTAEDVIEPFNPEYYGISVFSDEENPEIRLENGKVVCKSRTETYSFNLPKCSKKLKTFSSTPLSINSSLNS